MDKEEKIKHLRELKRKAKFVATYMRNADHDPELETLAKKTKEQLHKTGVLIRHLAGKKNN